MLRARLLTFLVTAFLVLAARSSLALAADAPVLVLRGDGLTVRVLTISEDETRVTGQLILDGTTYPFTGRISSEGAVETVMGTFRAGADAFDFTSTQRAGEELVTLTTGGTKYRLRPVDGEGVAQPNPAPRQDPPNLRPPAAQAKPTPRAGAPRKAKPAAAAAPAELRMRRVEFRDINMANVVAYTMLVPEGWEPEGHVEWSNDKTPYPQKKFTISGPDGARISFQPAMTFTYSEASAVAKQEAARLGIRSPIPDQMGTPPPEDLGAWVVDTVTQHNQQVSNVELVSDKRDEAAERAMAEQRRQLGAAANNGGQQWEVHAITIRYDMGGVPFLEEIHLSYAKLDPMPTRNMTIWNWMLFPIVAFRAPEAKFEQAKPLAYASAQSLRTVPQWFTQSQLLIMQATQRNHVIGMEEIRRRGQFYDQMSDADMAAWKKSVGPSSDAQQNDRINTIYEVDDFRDTDGTPVKLPIHYKNYYSDGKGNYVMTNSTLHEPGSDFTQIGPVK